MRLGTKILLLTLAITLGLGGAIVWVVTREVTQDETARARADIRRAVSDYFAHIETLHRQTLYPIIKNVTGDAANQGQLEGLENGEEVSREHFKLLFREVVKELPAPEPSFHVILNFEGKPLLNYAPKGAGLEAALSRDKIDWPYEPVLGEVPELTRRYVYVDGKLYLAMGIPLRMQASGPPTHAYFLGYLIDNAWVTLQLGSRPGGAVAQVGETPLHAWFVVDHNVVARGATSTMGRLGERAVANAAERELELFTANSSKPTAAATTTPVTARRSIAFDAEDEHYVGEAVAFDLPGGKRGAISVASSLTHALQRLQRLQRTIGWVTGGAILIAVVAFRFVSNFIARPVGQLLEGTRRVARGEFDAPIAMKRRDELGQLAAGFNEMAAGLQQRDLVKSTFGKFVDPKVVEGFLADPSRLMPGGEKRVQTILFSDLAEFTTLSEKLEPDDLVALLNGHLGASADIVTATRGIVDKFIGDAVVAFWGPPIVTDDEHAGLACRAASRMARSVRELDEHCARLGVPPLRVRVGVATGEVLVGIIGSANKYNYTVMGDTANLGSRLEGLNKLYGTQVLVTERTAREAEGVVFVRRVDRVRVVNRIEPVELYEVLGERDDAATSDGDARQRCEAYAEALARYERRAWAEAGVAFRGMCQHWPHDAPARAMAQRCVAFEESCPGDDWDGVWNATSK
jgi:class 3 adenylate cyclase